MAHALQTTTGIEDIDFSACPSPVDLVPGRFYKLTGLNQGILGDYEVLAVAESPTVLSSNIIVFPVLADTDTTGWIGLFDYSTCLLTYLRDDKNNEVAGSDNVTAFPWFNTNVMGNYVSDTAYLDLGLNFLGTFKDNRVDTSAIVIFNSPTSALLDIEKNIWSNNSETTLSSTIISGVLITNNLISSSQFNFDSSSDLGLISVDSNSILSNSTLLVGGLGSISVANNNIHSHGRIHGIAGDTQVRNFTSNTVSINGNIDAPGSASSIVFTENDIQGDVNLTNGGDLLDFTHNVITPSGFLEVATSFGGGSITLSDTRISGAVRLTVNPPDSLLTMNGCIVEGSSNIPPTFDFDFTANINAGTTHQISWVTLLPGSQLSVLTAAGDSNILNVFLAHAGYLRSFAGDNVFAIGVYVEEGLLDFGAFDVQNCRLQNANSTLVADKLNSKKDGYSGTLP